MFEGRYGKVLTVLLIVAIIAILALISFFVYDRIVKVNEEKERLAVTDQFDTVYPDKIASNDENDSKSESKKIDEEQLKQAEEALNKFNETATESEYGSADTSSSDGVYYKGFEVVGKIEIPKTNVKLPILNVVTKKSLETSVVILYPDPSKAKLNSPGNIVIAGHNYRNQLFFSNNKKLQSGDKIYIKDTSGVTLTYTVYSNFEAAPEDTSFYSRDTGGVPEITLTTCTSDSSKRTIILAKAD